MFICSEGFYVLQADQNFFCICRLMHRFSLAPYPESLSLVILISGPVINNSKLFSQAFYFFKFTVIPFIRNHRTYTDITVLLWFQTQNLTDDQIRIYIML